MRVIETNLLKPGEPESAELAHWCYNGLDCMLTSEIFAATAPQLDNVTRATYEFSKSLQGPVMEMKLRGVLVDQSWRAAALREFEDKRDRVGAQLNRLICEGVGFHPGTFNWASPHQLKELFYEVFGIAPVVRKGKVTVDREALEKLQSYFYCQPIVAHLLLLRELGKKIGVLKTGIDDDGRLRTSYNIAGTETGRFSSSLSDLGTGTNLQNIEDSLRRMVVADPGYKFAYIDLEQAESRAVGAICWNQFGLGNYLDACESGDLHTTVTRLSRPNLDWRDDPIHNRGLADGEGYRHLSMRDLSKKLGHGTNYGGRPATMARHSKLPIPVIAEFQNAYFTAFPEIPRWHGWVGEQLRSQGFLVSLSGRKRWFFGRRQDDSTLREAIAFDPQGSVGDILNRGMLEVWRQCSGLGAQLLMQIHDAILIQYPESREAEIVAAACTALEVPIELARGRTLRIPSDCMTGWNFAKQTEKNPDGLRKFKGSDARRRESVPKTSKLDFLLG